MAAWIAAQSGTLIVSVILLAVVFLIVRRLVKDRSEGKSSCGCGCEHCAMQGKCHSSAVK